MRCVFFYDKLDNTMSEYQRLKDVVEGANGKTDNPLNNPVLVRAGTQADGIGRADHVWISPPGGLWFTFDLQNIHSIPSFALYAGACLHHTLEMLFAPLSGKLQIKWTNDIICENRKLGGILCRYQQSKQSYIIGMGINTNNHIDENLGKFGAISLYEILGFPVDNAELCKRIINRIESPPTETMDETGYLTYCNNNLFGKGRIALIETGGLNIKAEILGINHSGALLLRKEMGDYITMHTGSILEILD